MKVNDLLRRLRKIAKERGLEIIEREGNGSHLVVKLDGRSTSIPRHAGDIKIGTYRGILKQLGLTLKDVE